jgi:hypothetical protein
LDTAAIPPQSAERFRSRKTTTTTLVQHRADRIITEFYRGNIDHPESLQSNAIFGNPQNTLLDSEIYRRFLRTASAMYTTPATVSNAPIRMTAISPCSSSGPAADAAACRILGEAL